MRVTVVALATVVVLLLGLVGFAQPAAAAPAEPYRLAGCTTSSDGLFKICFEARGVRKVNVTPSGNIQVHETGELCQTLTDTVTGEVLSDGCQKTNVVYHEKDGEQQVYHSNGKSAYEITRGGTTYECTLSYNLTYANGELRHHDYQLECTPLL